MPICRDCHEDVEYANSNRCRTCYNAYMRDYNLARYHRNRAEGIELLGGKCVDCGSVENLEFDHVDPNSKEREIGKLQNYYREKFLGELAKCVLRCRGCHAIRSAAQRAVGHGEGLTGKRNCKCSPCKARKNEYMRKWKRDRKEKRDVLGA